jgi:hypothetical protein
MIILLKSLRLPHFAAVRQGSFLPKRFAAFPASCKAAFAARRLWISLYSCIAVELDDCICRLAPGLPAALAAEAARGGAVRKP